MRTYQVKLFEDRTAWLYVEVPDDEDPQSFIDANIDTLWEDASEWNIKDCDYELWGEVEDETTYP